MPTRAWWWGFVLIAGLGLAFYLTLARVIQTTATKEFLGRQQTLARAQAANLTYFFQDIGNSTAVLAQSANIEVMESFVNKWVETGLIGGVILIDRNGIVQFNSSVLGTPDIGGSLVDRDYFLWAKSQVGEGEYFVGQPVVSRLGASKGKVIIPVASPVVRDGVFSGVVVSSVILEPLTSRYLELMKISETAAVYLAKEGGELLYSSSGGVIEDLNIFDLLGDGLKNILCTNQEAGFQTEKRLIACAPVLLDSQSWMVVIVSPAEDVTSVVTPIYIRQMVIFLLVTMGILLFGILVSREHKLQNNSWK
jgi:hypothetical protein